MKKLILILGLLCVCSNLYSQDTITFEDKIRANNRTAGDYLIRSANQKYASLGLGATSALVFVLGINIEDTRYKATNPTEKDENKGSRIAVYSIGTALGFTAVVYGILSIVSIEKAGIKLNANTSIGVTPNGVGATIKF